MLDGVFQDEHGNYPAGSYVRNPPTSRHRPGSEPGCTIFVKLWQFDPDDRTEVRLNLFDPAPGADAREIFGDERERVSVEFWRPDAEVRRANESGLEVLCLKGGFSEGGEDFAEWSWLRLPPGLPLDAQAGAQGAFLWVKEGHLRFAEREIAAVKAASA